MNRLTTILLSLALFASLLVVPADADARQQDRQVWRDSAPAQPMSGPTPPGLPDKPTQTPIGSGLGLLLAAGGAFAVRRLRQQKED